MNSKQSKKQRIKLMLLAGQSLTQKYLNQTLDLTNSPELVRQLREEGMNIETEWKVSEKGTRFGVYKYVKPPKIDRIKTRQYMNQA